MRNALLASVAIFVMSASSSFAAVPAVDLELGVSTPATMNLLVLADNDGDHGGGGDNGGHGGDDDNDNDDDDDDDDRDADRGGRDHPRIPGGTGCDDPGDVAEHPECGGAAPAATQAGGGGLLGLLGQKTKGRKKRIPGGPGCDDAGDIAEHAECR